MLRAMEVTSVVVASVVVASVVLASVVVASVVVARQRDPFIRESAPARRARRSARESNRLH